jgi:hypothetical protein
MSEYKLCRLCGQPMKPKGVKKLPNEYDHATGCPYGRKQYSQQVARSIIQEIEEEENERL